MYINAERECIWNEHITKVAEMLNVITAADHQKYFKAMVTHLAEMRSVPQTEPEVEEEFQKGPKRKFCCEKSGWEFQWHMDRYGFEPLSKV